MSHPIIVCLFACGVVGVMYLYANISSQCPCENVVYYSFFFTSQFMWHLNQFVVVPSQKCVTFCRLSIESITWDVVNIGNFFCQASIYPLFLHLKYFVDLGSLLSVDQTETLGISVYNKKKTSDCPPRFFNYPENLFE